ncbi:3-hydroxyacyl-ACP dehydratase FabZ [Candidatus Tisiphia endosymbiont of Hybos culiciformis]|uniref:3-hydroxyacyl-ACP dehydratase FabZ n=1 Tax=Candidatus Tisiphia endosymbiont of Hybos culiciformis TaxID=3139331 RepID=UPI003CCB6906
MKINIVEIMEMLPHRYPFLLIDKVLEFKLNESILGIKNVTFNEPHFTGHFPTKPVMPGVLIIEAMAQLSAILVAKSMDFKKDKDVFFMSIEEAKFRKIVEPGDTLHIYAKVEQNRASVWKFSSNAKVDDQIVAESKFTAMFKNRN